MREKKRKIESRKKRKTLRPFSQGKLRSGRKEIEGVFFIFFWKLVWFVALVDFLDGWAIVASGTTSSTSARESTWTAWTAGTWEATWGSTTFTTGTVEFHHDGVGNTRDVC